MLVYIGKHWFQFNQKKSSHEPKIFITGDIQMIRATNLNSYLDNTWV